MLKFNDHVELKMKPFCKEWDDEFEKSLTIAVMKQKRLHSP